ncbi:hypothetical protein [Methanogenium cariaci]|uniref:hypothetical protein n=1 Tax=Methanogenium cariaci TaxID=2197 RepID=UPI0007833AFC|nr:hypothetical protein [Methanogenium cariaci]
MSGNHGLYDLWVVKLNTRGGALTWQRCLGGTSLDRAYDVRQTSDGGYVVVGNTKSVDGDVSGNHGGYDAWVVKLNSNGEITWSHCLGGSGIDEACGVRQTADGGYIIAGDTASIDGDVVGKCSGGDSDGWVVKLNSDGAIVWQSCLGGTEDDAVSGIRQIADGYVVAGYTFSNDGDVSANHGRSDVWVVKLNTDGEIVWQSCLGGSDNDYVTKKSSSGIQQTLDGGFIVAGHTCSNDGDVSGIHNVDKTDGWVVKLDCDGALTWQRCLGGSSNYDQLSSVCQTADGEYLVGGYAMSNDGDLSDNHGNKDGWVVKLNGDGDRVWQRCFGGFDYDNVRSVCQTRDEGYLLIMATSSTDGDVSDPPLGSTDFWIVKLEGNGTVPPTGLSFAPPTPAEIGPGGGAAEVSIMLDSLPPAACRVQPDRDACRRIGGRDHGGILP